MSSRRRPLGPGSFIARFVSLALVGVLAVGTSAAGSVDPVVAPDTTEWSALEDAGFVAVAPSPVAIPEAAAELTPEASEQAAEDEATTTFVSLDPAPSAGPFEMNLFEKGDFVKQATSSMCVGSATQTMINMIDSGDPNRKVAYQRKLYALARKLSVSQEKLSSSGADPSGWVAALNKKGYGPYVLETADTYAGAMKKAATAIRETGKPVGLVVWGGRHAWVMSGFTATADPGYTNDFRVTGAYIEDPLGEVSANTLMRMNRLSQEFREYHRGGLYPKREGQYVLVLPVLEEDTVVG